MDKKKVITARRYSWIMVAERLQPAAVTFVCPSMTVRGTLVEGHLFLGGKGFSQFHKTTIWGRKTNSGAKI